MKENFSKEQIEEMLKNSTDEIAEDNSDLVDEFGNVHNVDDVIVQAEKSGRKIS